MNALRLRVSHSSLVLSILASVDFPPCWLITRSFLFSLSFLLQVHKAPCSNPLCILPPAFLAISPSSPCPCVLRCQDHRITPAGRSEAQGHLWLHQKFKASLSYVRPHPHRQVIKQINKTREMTGKALLTSLLARPLMRTRLASMCEAWSLRRQGRLL